jgi:hypothetical protein
VARPPSGLRAAGPRPVGYQEHFRKDLSAADALQANGQTLAKRWCEDAPGSFVPEGRLAIAQRFIAGYAIQINRLESRRTTEA